MDPWNPDAQGTHLMPAPLLKQSTRRLSTMRLMAGMHENTPAVGGSRAEQGWAELGSRRVHLLRRRQAGQLPMSVAEVRSSCAWW